VLLLLAVTQVTKPDELVETPTSEPQRSDMPSYGLTLTPRVQNWITLDNLLTELSSEALAQEQDLNELRKQLAESLTEANELSYLLTESKRHLIALEQATDAEREVYRQTITAQELAIIDANRYRFRWKVATFVTSAIAVIAVAIVIAPP
jgi:hypothetical protein